MRLVGFDLLGGGGELTKQEYIDVIIDQKPKLFSYAALKPWLNISITTNSR